MPVMKVMDHHRIGDVKAGDNPKNRKRAQPFINIELLSDMPSLRKSGANQMTET